jgi:hypothetical protein
LKLADDRTRVVPAAVMERRGEKRGEAQMLRLHCGHENLAS